MLDYKTITFLTLCEQMNYRKTAQLLNMTQPGVTQHIHALEKEFGCKLFSYSGKTLALTEQGKLYRSHLQKVRYDEEWLKRKMTEQVTPKLNIGATKSIGDYMISNQLIALLNSGRYNVNLIVDNTQNLLLQIEQGVLDFAMIEGEFDKASFGHRKMQSEDFVGICPCNHRFAECEVNLSDVLSEHILVREEGSGTRSILVNQLFLQGETLKSFASMSCISSFRVMKEIIAKGHGITFGYKSIIAGDIRLATFSVDGFFPYHDLYYVYQKDSASEVLIDEYLMITENGISSETI